MRETRVFSVVGVRSCTLTREACVQILKSLNP